MHKYLVIFTAAAALSAAPIQDPTRTVNEFIGTGGHGHTHPGATLPFGMVQLGPDTLTIRGTGVPAITIRTARSWASATRT